MPDDTSAYIMGRGSLRIAPARSSLPRMPAFFADLAISIDKPE